MLRANRRQLWITCVATIALISTAFDSRRTEAAPIVFNGTGTNTTGGLSTNLAASAEFDVVNGNMLQVVLSNVGGDVLRPSDVLTAMFFSLAGVDPGTLTTVSAIIAAGSTVLNDPYPTDGNVGGEWGFEEGIVPPPEPPAEGIHLGDMGIGSAGLGYFGQANFNGPDLDPPTALNGMNYGLLSEADDVNTGNPQVISGSVKPFVKHSVVFLLANLPETFSLSDISNVSFQYGTDFDEPGFKYIPSDPPDDPDNSVPEPTSMALFGLTAFGMGIMRRRRNTANVA